MLKEKVKVSAGYAASYTAYLYHTLIRLLGP